MKAHAILGRASVFLAFPAVLFTVLLYLYPVFLGCSFPESGKTPSRRAECAFDAADSCDIRDGPRSSRRAPFRLLAFGDPQLEGDSSLPNPDAPLLPGLQRVHDISRTSGISNDIETLFESFKAIFSRDIPKLAQSYRKRLDLIGNDYYLAHIYRTLRWRLDPTHVAVLGDLIGSQWVTDEEFERRGRRFWNTVFKRGRRVEDAITNVGSTEALGQDSAWSDRVINIAGNHDIGYAGDLSRGRLERFERTFGKANWEIKFHLPERNITEAGADLLPVRATPMLRLVVLNNMNMDGPGFDPLLQKETYDFLNDQIISSSRPVEDRTTGTIVLTHIPLHKEAGVCVDGPFFDHGLHGIREQNHLSQFSSSAILEGVFSLSGNPDAPASGFGRNGIIMTGHDHEGCDVRHYVLPKTEQQAAEWKASKWEESLATAPGESVRGVREVTVRSMMGSFGGNAGLLSAWFDDEAGEWRFEYATCSAGVQHIWWAVHILDLIVLTSGAIAALLRLYDPLPLFALRVRKSPEGQKTKRLRKKSSKARMNGHLAIPGRSRDSPSPSSIRRKKKP